MRSSWIWARRVALVLLAAAAVSICAGGAWSFPSKFNTYCSGCHNNDTATCNGCHHHRGTLTANKDQAQYFPGQTVTVTLNGGTQSGWIRGILYDDQNVEIARRTGPTGTGDDSAGNPVVFPVQLQAPAPAVPGVYTWKAAWFGHPDDSSSPTHEELRVNVTITVVADPGDVTDDQPTFLQKSWSRLKERFAR